MITDTLYVGVVLGYCVTSRITPVVRIDKRTRRFFCLTFILKNNTIDLFFKCVLTSSYVKVCRTADGLLKRLGFPYLLVHRVSVSICLLVYSIMEKADICKAICDFEGNVLLIHNQLYHRLDANLASIFRVLHYTSYSCCIFK